VRPLIYVLLALLFVAIGYAQAPDTKPAGPPALQSVLVPAIQPSAPASYDSAATPRINQTFRRTLVKAAENAYRAGDITRRDLAIIRVGSLIRPQAVAEAQAVATEEALQAKVITAADATAGSFDWGKLMDFLAKILPLLLALFG
jgi:hypothetical protein